MTVRTSLALALALALVGCKKDKKDPGTAGSGTGAGTASAAPPVLRPSQAKLPALADPTWPDDPKRADKVKLGHALFFDKRLSGDGALACYSCHQNEDGNGGHDPLAVGAFGKVQPRHAPVMWNVAFYDQQKALYWDGRSPNLEALTKAAWGGGNMGAGADKLDAKTAEVAKIKGYDALFAAAFPDVKPGEYKADHAASALAEYQRTLICKDTAYDKFAGGDKTALTEAQQRGLDVFLGKGQCAVCHAPPHFSTAMSTDGGFYQNVGVGTVNADGTPKPEAEIDVGRFKVSNKPEDFAAFKPPSLRNVAKSAPYFHDGSVAKLDEAVKIMATGGIANPKKSMLARDTQLTAEELADLVAFMGALDCPGKLEPPADAPK